MATYFDIFKLCFDSVLVNSLLVSFSVALNKLPHIDKSWNMYFTSFRCNRILFRWYTNKEWFRSILVLSCSAVGVHRLELMGTLQGEIWAGPQLSVDFVTSGRKLIGNQPNYQILLYAWFYCQICFSSETNKLLVSCQLISPDLIMHWRTNKENSGLGCWQPVHW